MASRLCFGRLLALLLLPSAVWAQPVTTVPGRGDATLEQAGIGQPVASDGGSVTLSRPVPVAEAEDPVNRLVAAETVDGLILVVTIDGDRVKLESAAPARIPRGVVRGNREGFGDGGSVKATAFAGAERVASVDVPDNVLAASEGEGLVRVTRRQLSIPIPVERAVDRVEVEAPMTGARATLDVRGAYAPWCRADPNGKSCPPGAR